jgi:hypothetical protein
MARISSASSPIFTAEFIEEPTGRSRRAGITYQSRMAAAARSASQR